jgi:hypothetical protein
LGLLQVSVATGNNPLSRPMASAKVGLGCQSCETKHSPRHGRSTYQCRGKLSQESGPVGFWRQRLQQGGNMTGPPIGSHNGVGNGNAQGLADDKMRGFMGGCAAAWQN